MAISGLSCIFPVPDIERTAEFYVRRMSFREVRYLDCDEPHICLYRDGAEILLLRAGREVLPNRVLYGYGYDAYLYTDEQEALEREMRAAGVRIVRALNTTDYGNREFVVEDADGRWLAFGRKQ